MGYKNLFIIERWQASHFSTFMHINILEGGVLEPIVSEGGPRNGALQSLAGNYENQQNKKLTVLAQIIIDTNKKIVFWF